ATYGGYFDSVTKDTLEGGAWLQSAYFDGNIVRGWYHAETNTHYGAITAPNGVQYADITHKSVGYVESNDGGLTFTKPNYPSNQVLSPYTPDANTCADPMGCELGIGDMTVTRMGDYF